MVEEEGKSKRRRPPLRKEQSERTERQNLYPLREIMVLGVGLRNGILAIPNPISRSKAIFQKKKGRSLCIQTINN
ncbi:MAG: hypothetical protein JSW00_14520 [Thermoplasmata archaeon]|nr:MAG: hypothetical protein JSW00_14520 [Thermoplasmata archaeon]